MNISPASSLASQSLATGQISAETAVGQSIDAFAESLYSQIQSEAGGSGNLFLSPLSISTALAMTYAGAEGQTASQMAAALHYTLNSNALAADFGSLLTDLNSAGGSNYSLAVADALWGQQGYSFVTPFLNLMQADYGGGLHQVDFVNDAQAARQTINNWVAQQTNNKIQNLIPPGALDSLTRLVLTNALYFKGMWATPFNPNLTQDATFTLGSGNQVQIPTMHATASYAYMQSDGYQVLELPYAGNRMVMDVLLPTSSSGLSGLSAGQLPANLNAWLRGMAPQQVQVSLPKFQLTTQYNLVQPLAALGMTDAFSPNADFSGISIADPLSISAVVHKAFVDVDEAGTEATAATGVAVGIEAVGVPSLPSVIFNADHPFLFLIRDTQSGSILFMGQVANPSTTGGDSEAPALPSKPTNPIVINPPLAPSGVQLIKSTGSSYFESGFSATSPQFEVSGLAIPSAGGTAEVIVDADGIQIGEAAVDSTSVAVTTNCAMLGFGTHKITAFEEVNYPASDGMPGETSHGSASNADTVKVVRATASISLYGPTITSKAIDQVFATIGT